MGGYATVSIHDLGPKVVGTIGGKELTISTGFMAKQASGAAVVQCGDTVVLVTAVGAPAFREADFFPLTVDYREKTYAAGKIPGGYFKREGRPSTKEILTMRLIDRPVRPLFPKGYRDEVQIMCAVLSADNIIDPDSLAMVGASAALSLSGLPFAGPTGSVRVCRVKGELVVNPTKDEIEEADLELVVAGTKNAIMMVEGEAKEVPEEDLVKAILCAHESIKQIVDLQFELLQQCGKEAYVPEKDKPVDPVCEMLKPIAMDELKKRLMTEGKMARSAAVKEYRNELIEAYASEEDDGKPTPAEIKSAFESLQREALRRMVIDDNIRCDGRKLTDVRPITIELGTLPRAHGSALFTRGETQALVVATLGTKTDEQKIDTLDEVVSKRFMLHYNFPPFCVGEAKPIRSVGRREIGHGNLAERSIEQVLPTPEEFSYTIRIVSDVLESNGSSSMASVCGASLCLMDAGVPTHGQVAGIALGLVKEGDEVRILSDILGSDDHCGDMDFKVAGTAKGVTGLQMDIKIDGINETILTDALAQAREGRLHILSVMNEAIAEPRPQVSPYAPKILRIQIDPDKIGSIIGPGGKIIRKMQDETGARIEVQDDGTVLISSEDAENAEAAKKRIESLTEEIQVGRIYEGTVVSIKDFGAFVQILPGQDGLLHISEMSDDFVDSVEDVVSIGDEVKVKVLEIDGQGRVRLSRKGLSGNGEGGKMQEESGARVAEEIQVGRIYEGTVVSIKDFGAFVQILPGQDGLLHISEMSDDFVDRVEDVVSIGDDVKVKVLEVDGKGRVRLSRKGLSGGEEN